MSLLQQQSAFQMRRCRVSLQTVQALAREHSQRQHSLPALARKRSQREHGLPALAREQSQRVFDRAVCPRSPFTFSCDDIDCTDQTLITVSRDRSARARELAFLELQEFPSREGTRPNVHN